MGYGFYRGDRDTFWLNIFNWEAMLTIARRHGWIPAGTQLSLESAQWTLEMQGVTAEETQSEVAKADPEWDGTYFSNDWQTVTAEDAANIAAALRRFLARSYSVAAHVCESIALDRDSPAMLVCKAMAEQVHGIDPAQYRPGLDVPLVRRFAEFCERGAFLIT